MRSLPGAIIQVLRQFEDRADRVLDCRRARRIHFEYFSFRHPLRSAFCCRRRQCSRSKRAEQASQDGDDGQFPEPMVHEEQIRVMVVEQMGAPHAIPQAAGHITKE